MLAYLFLLIPVVPPLLPLEELHLPQLLMHSSSYTPPTPRQTSHSGHMRVLVLIRAKSGLNGPIMADVLAAPAAPVPDFVLCRCRQSLKKRPPPPPSELPPVEATGGHWLAVEAEGKQDCFSFINGKASSFFAPR